MLDNQMFQMMMFSVISSMAIQVTGSFDRVLEILGVCFVWLWKNFKRQWYGKQNYVYIERMFENSPQDVNNKILIDALLHGSEYGHTFQVQNKAMEKKHEHEYAREKSRKLIIHKDEAFEENGIHVSLELKTRKELVEPDKKDGEKIERDIPDKEIMTLRSTKSAEEIMKYIERKKQDYIEAVCSHDNKLYVFNPIYYNSHLQFNKTEFGSSKSFANWFVPEKDQLERLISDFENHTGVYKLPSTQHKLVILLHGEPGCGKSSFSKALAARLKRHLLPASLDKFTSKRSFDRFFYEENMYNEEDDCWEYVPFKKRIYILEEIDTAGPIVMDREKLRKLKNNEANKWLQSCSFYSDYSSNKKKAGKRAIARRRREAKKQRKIKATLAKTRTKMMLEWSEKEAKMRVDEKTDAEIEDAKSAFNENIESTLELERIELEEEFEEEDDDDDKDEDDDDDDKLFDDSMDSGKPIHLGDVLTIFDGITELKDFVCVITTNHREYLDPALVRPGRITYEIELKRMRAPEIVQMLSYYYITHNCFDEEAPVNKKRGVIARIAAAWDGKLKPSKIETLCQRNPLQALYKKYLDLLE